MQFFARNEQRLAGQTFELVVQGFSQERPDLVPVADRLICLLDGQFPLLHSLVGA